MSLIHRYQSNGYNIVLDINSGCIHLVDEVTYEVLPYMEEGLDSSCHCRTNWEISFQKKILRHQWLNVRS